MACERCLYLASVQILLQVMILFLSLYSKRIHVVGKVTESQQPEIHIGNPMLPPPLPPTITPKQALDLEENRLFLHQIDNLEVRQMTADYLQLCPYTKLCNFSLNGNLELLTLGKNPCCSSCSCGVNCPHELNKLPTHAKHQDVTCSTGKVLQSNSFNEPAYEFQDVHVCVKESDSRLSYLCNEPFEKRGDDLNLADLVPVTDIGTNRTFRNIYCALCTGLDVSNVIPWTPEMFCEMSPNVSDLQNPVSYVLNGWGCYIHSTPSTAIIGHVKYCSLYYIKTCNQTGLWEKYDSFTERACLSFDSTYVDTLMYRNVFCALCNGIKIKPDCDPVIDLDAPFSPPVTFSTLLDFTLPSGNWKLEKKLPNRDNIITLDTNSIECDSGQIFDAFMNVCLTMDCPPLSYLQNETCTLESSESDDVLFEALLKVNSQTKMTVKEAFAVDVISHFQDQLHSGQCSVDVYIKAETNQSSYNVTRTELEQSTVINFIIKLRLIANNTETMMIQLNQTISTGIRPLKCPAQLHSFDLELLWTDSYFYPGRTDTVFFDDVERLCTDRNESPHDPSGNNNFNHLAFSSFTSLARDPHDNRILLNVDIMKSSYTCPDIYKITQVSHLIACTLVELPRDTFQYIETSTGIYISKLKWSISYKDFYAYDEFSIFVCKDYYVIKTKQLISDPVHTPDQASYIEVILGLVCSAVSVACLILSLSVFCMFKELRTVPGKNNMMLMLTLALAQVLFIIITSSDIQIDWLCKTVGALVHCLWLSAVFWMGVCCFHMFKVFIRIEKQQVGESKSISVIYTIFVNVISLALVMSNVIVSLILSDGESMGYGDPICYISSGWMVLFTFAVPVGIVLFGNLVMFAVVVIKIKTMPSIQKNVKNERNNTVIFAKLSTLTGAMWIFGFVYQFTRLVAFSYLFIILNASQGVFLMLSFVCTRRIWIKLRRKLSGNSGLGETSQSSKYQYSKTASTKV